MCANTQSVSWYCTVEYDGCNFNIKISAVFPEIFIRV